MMLLTTGSSGPQTELLQTALNRAGFGPLTVDGVFQSKTRAALVRFQKANGLNPDGVAGPRTHEALMPWYTGYRTHTLRRGDTFYRLAAAYGTTVAAIETANPTADPLRLPIGGKLTIPLPFPVVSTQVRWFSEYTRLCCRGLTARYPALASTGEYGRSVLEQPLWQLTLGNGKNRVLYNASHHANEWITTPLLLTFAEQLLAAAASGGMIFGQPAAALLQESTLLLAPAVNPDGIDLVTGALENNAAYLSAFRLSRNYPDIPFPDGWKANIQGVDLNLQYPAGWSTAKSIKFAQGFTLPGPRDYVGSAPLAAPESRALYDLTLAFDPALTLSLHTQGRVIYWKFLNYEPENSRQIAMLFSRVSGYEVEETPYSSGFAGYKDWFIQEYDRPGYTIESGLGTNPLPLSQLPQMQKECLGIFVLGARVTADGVELAQLGG